MVLSQAVPSDTAHSLDFQLAFHCAPTLAGLKPASLISVKYFRFPLIEEMLPHYRSHFQEENLALEVLSTCETHLLVILYNPLTLGGWIHQPAHHAFLSRCGYSFDDLQTVEAALSKLKERFSLCSTTYPHEVGVFLGYPLEDVEGFILHRGENAKCCGSWKVYGDETSARAKFSLYQKVTKLYCEMLDSESDLFSVCSKLRRNKTWQTLQ